MWLVRDFLKISQVVAIVSFTISVGVIIYVLKFKLREEGCHIYVNSTEWKNKLKGSK